MMVLNASRVWTECEGAVFDPKNLFKTRYGWEGNQRFVFQAALDQGLIAPAGSRQFLSTTG